MINTFHRKDQVSECLLKDAVQAHILPVHIPPGLLPAALRGRQVRGRQVRGRQAHGRRVRIHQVHGTPVHGRPGRVPLVPGLPEAGLLIPQVPVRAGILPQAEAAGRASTSPEGFTARADMVRRTITDSVMITFFSRSPGRMKRQVRIMRKGITTRPDSIMTRFLLKKTAGTKMLSVTVRTADRMPL